MSYDPRSGERSYIPRSGERSYIPRSGERSYLTPLPRHRALALLGQCRGDEIWSVETCRRAGVPETWIERFADAFESGFQSDRQTIYDHQGVTNQFHGVRDLDLALELGRSLGLKVDRITATTVGPLAAVAAIKDAVMEGE